MNEFEILCAISKELSLTEISVGNNLQQLPPETDRTAPGRK